MSNFPKKTFLCYNFSSKKLKTKKMIKAGFKRGFTLVELLIVVGILAVLSGAAYVGIQRSQARVMNEKVLDDLSAIVNALEQYKQDNGEYPASVLGADKNVSCFKADTSYSHDCTDSYAEFMQTQVDNILLTKRYLQEVPTDPRTQSRYSYGATLDGSYFQVAGNYLEDDGTYVAKVIGNVEKGYSLPSLIRSFDGPNFVLDGESYLPYSPDHLSLTAKLHSLSGTVTVDGLPATEGMVVNPGQFVATSGMGSGVTLYFSDGSITYLDEDTNMRVLSNSDVEQNDEDGIITKIRLKLFSGKIWNKVARLAEASEFNVETTTAIAGVRGTEFGIDAGGQELIVLNGTVVAREKTPSEASASGGTDQFLEFTSDPNVDDFLANQEAVGDGTFSYAQFPIPVPNGTMPNQGVAVSAQIQNDIEEKFYKPPFSNNIKPRILSIDTTNVPPEIVFGHMENVHKIVAMAHDKESQQGQWDSLVIQENPGISLSVDASVLSGYPNSNGLLRFRFEDIDGNRTGYSNPFVIVEQGLTLTENDIHNLLAQSSQGQQGPKPDINVDPGNLDLFQSGQFESVNACNWSIVSGGGYFSTTPTNTTSVNYGSVDLQQNSDNLIADVSGRFATQQWIPLTIRCTDPLDVNNFDEVTVNLTYKPWKVSNAGALYQYSWFAKNNITWSQAQAECGALQEGGVAQGTWRVPKKADFDLTDAMANNNTTTASEMQLWCGTFGADCGDMPDGTGATWLFEDFDATNGYRILGNTVLFSTLPKNTAINAVGVRCVK